VHKEIKRVCFFHPTASVFRQQIHFVDANNYG